MDDVRTVGEIGEEGLLAAILERLPRSSDAASPGDDAAILRSPGGTATLFATDMIVEGIDFDLALSSGADVGWKALAINVSDIAAMGGRPTDVVVSLGMPASTPVAVFSGLLDGLLEGCAEWELRLVGGDLSGASQLVCNVAILGITEREPVTRAGAAVGDRIWVTGSFGGSAAGLLALREEMAGISQDVDSAIERYRRPIPRPKEGQAVADVGATAMIDVSDGLGLDLLRLLGSSGVGCDIASERIPLARGVVEVCHRIDREPIDVALGGGEDQELIFTAPRELGDEIEVVLSELGASATILGHVTAGEPLLDGEPLRDRKGLGWEHLKNR